VLTATAQTSRFHAEKAISDLESYSNILKNMERKLTSTEQERARVTAELKELKERYVKLISSS